MTEAEKAASELEREAGGVDSDCAGPAAIEFAIYCVGAELDATLDEGAEKTAGIRKLIEAKDCLVRARLEMGS